MMAECPFYDICRDEENDALDADCKNDSYLRKGCYRGFVKIAYTLTTSVIPELPGVDMRTNHFHN